MAAERAPAKGTLAAYLIISFSQTHHVVNVGGLGPTTFPAKACAGRTRATGAPLMPSREGAICFSPWQPLGDPAWPSFAEEKGGILGVPGAELQRGSRIGHNGRYFGISRTEFESWLRYFFTEYLVLSELPTPQL